MFESVKKIFWRILFIPWKYSGRVSGFERLFRKVKDPWGFEGSVFEEERFKVMRELMLKTGCGSVIELGCGEGYFTEKISEDCSKLVCLDVSETAIARAMKRTCIPDYVVGDFTKDGVIPEKDYDVAVAGEVFYYIKEDDIPKVLEKIDPVYLITSNCLGLNHRCEEKIVETGYTQLEKKTVKRLESPQPKKTTIILWMKKD